eukprot:Rhum_TRINITY_DN5811_c0_g2::Rhum_TRINITY_DN5811_c0_g2_i1::g.18427::m.18427
MTVLSVSLSKRISASSYPPCVEFVKTISFRIGVASRSGPVGTRFGHCSSVGGTLGRLPWNLRVASMYSSRQRVVGTLRPRFIQSSNSVPLCVNVRVCPRFLYRKRRSPLCARVTGVDAIGSTLAPAIAAFRSVMVCAATVTRKCFPSVRAICMPAGSVRFRAATRRAPCASCTQRGEVADSRSRLCVAKNSITHGTLDSSTLATVGMDFSVPIFPSSGSTMPTQLVHDRPPAFEGGGPPDLPPLLRLRGPASTPPSVSTTMQQTAAERRERCIPLLPVLLIVWTASHLLLPPLHPTLEQGTMKYRYCSF